MEQEKNRVLGMFLNDLQFLKKWFCLTENKFPMQLSENRNYRYDERYYSLFDEDEPAYKRIEEIDKLYQIVNHLQKQTWDNVCSHFEAFWKKDISPYNSKISEGKMENNYEEMLCFFENWNSSSFRSIQDELLLCEEWNKEIIECHESLKEKIYAIALMFPIRNIDNNIVLIGKNGSGKSTFANALSGVQSSNLSFIVLAAQHCLQIKEMDERYYGNPIDELRELQKGPVFGSGDYYIDSMPKMINALLDDYVQNAFNYYNGGAKETSYLQKVLELWSELFPNISFRVSRDELIPIDNKGCEYEFNSMSDGEKTVFYYIGHVLMVSDDSYIIIDEPENHMNSGLSRTLWNRLEMIRKDCKFIYITHDLEFAATRLDSTKLWNKRYLSPTEWDVQEIEGVDEFPEQLLYEILGAKDKVIVCEGVNNSYDNKLYSILFPNYIIKSAGGHKKVIDFVKSCRKQTFFPFEVKGIIDRDWHEDEWCNKLREDDIFTININEIENIFCDIDIINNIIEYLGLEQKVIDDYLNKFWDLYKQRIDEQSKNYTIYQLNSYLKKSMVSSQKSISDICNELEERFGKDNVEKDYLARKKQLEEIYANKDYENALKIINFKGTLLRIAKDTLVSRYPEIVLKRINSCINLKDIIINKYFKDFIKDNC